MQKKIAEFKFQYDDLQQRNTELTESIERIYGEI